MAKLNFNNLGYIEKGTHSVTFETIRNELTLSSQRLALFKNFESFIKEFYCNNELVHTIYLLGSFASRKPDPSDIDLAIKFSEKNINSNSSSNSIFNEDSIINRFNIQLVYIDLENKDLKKYLPISKFASKNLYLFRRLKFEEKKKINIEERNPNFDFDIEDKGIIQIDFQDFCV